jgi:hypothetical protein
VGRGKERARGEYVIEVHCIHYEKVVMKTV